MGAMSVPSSALVCAALVLAAPGTDPAPRAQNVYPAWTAGTPYKPGDLVSYLGVCYICQRAHIAATGREPPAAADLWRVFSGQESQPPAAPQGLAAKADGSNRIVVSWSLVQGAAGYDLMADGAILGGVSSPFLHCGLAAASQHGYRVRAVNDAGPGDWSEPVSCATDGGRAVPSGR